MITSNDTVPSNDIKLYAKWEAIKVEITFDPQVATISSTKQIKLFGSNYDKKEDAITIERIPEPNTTGYTFEGWFTEREGGTKISNLSFVNSPEDHKLFAHWVPTIPKELLEKDLLGVVIEADKMRASENDIINYTITFANISGIEVDNVVVEAVFPDKLNFVNALDSGKFTDDKIVWKVETLKPQTKKQYTFMLKVKDKVEVDDYAIVTASISSSERTMPINPENYSSFVKSLLVSKSRIYTHLSYIKGYPDGTVKPNILITRAEIATIFAKSLDLEISKRENNLFTDVKKDHWAVDYIEAVVDNEIFSGYDNNTFRPNNQITRGELASAISNYNNSSIYKKTIHPLLTLNRYTDLSNHWAKNSIEDLFRNKYISQDIATNQFKPEQGVFRKEAIALFNKMFYRGPLNNVNQSFPDNFKSEWYFGEIEEATRSHKVKYSDYGSEILLEFIDSDSEE